MADAEGVRMIRYTGTEALRLKDEAGKLDGYFSPDAQLAVGDHNREKAEELLGREDFEVVDPPPADGEAEEVAPTTAEAEGELLSTETASEWVPGGARTPSSAAVEGNELGNGATTADEGEE